MVSNSVENYSSDTLETVSEPSPPVSLSVIIPVKNEEASIERLLYSLLEQTLTPAEIVITDGGSQDRTREIIRRFQTISSVPIVLIETDQAFPGRGRNLAIARATNEWVACIDGGVVPRQDWLQELVKTARREPDAKIVYGKYEPLTNSYFTECAAITYLPASDAKTRFIASSLLQRSAWKTAGGFPEDLRSAEDLLFFRRLDNAGVQAAYSDEAVVTWELQPSARSTFRRFAIYSRSNLKAGLAGEWQFNVMRFYAVLLGLFVIGLRWYWPVLLLPPVLILLRAERRIWNWFRVKAPRRLWRELLSPRRVLLVAGINLLIDLAMFYGTLKWLLYDRSKSDSANSV